MVEIVAIVKFINSFFIPMWIPLLFFQVSDFFPPPLWGQDRDSEKALLLLLLPLFFLRISRSLNKETLACRIPSGQKLDSFRWYALRYFLIGEGKEGKSTSAHIEGEEGKVRLSIPPPQKFCWWPFSECVGSPNGEERFLEDIDAEEKNCHFWWKCFEKLFQEGKSLFVERYIFCWIMILSNTEYNIGDNLFFFFFPSFPSSSSSIKFVPSSMEASLPKIISPREEGQSRHLTKRSLFDTCLTSLSSISFFFPFFRAWKSSFLREYAVLEKMARVPFFRMWDNECKSVKFNGPGQRGKRNLDTRFPLSTCG